MTHFTRRDFLNRSTGLATLGLAGLSQTLFAGESQDSPADRPPIRIALMGVNGRGKQLLPDLVSFPEVEIAYICDPDADTIPSAIKLVEDKGRPAPKVEKDFRVALDDPGVTALVCAAPDHWHALATIWGCQAGKDVYVEKPCCHNPREGQQMIAAARRYGRVVQVGSQRRSGADMQALVDYLRSGKLGKIPFVRSWITSTRPNIGRVEVTPAPENLDFNLWCGPAPDHGYRKNLVHYHWHWRWEYGTGECGNNGIHGLDVARWGLGVEYPERVVCGGGKNFFDDDQETPDTQLATFDFPGVTLQWEHRTWSPRGIDGESFGVEFYGTEGTLVTNGRGWKVYSGKGAKEEVVEQHEGADPQRPHLRNFLDCITSREKPHADIEIAHRSTLLCHLANIAYRSRSTVNFDGSSERILDNPAAEGLFGRDYRPGFEIPSIG